MARPFRQAIASSFAWLKIWVVFAYRQCDIGGPSGSHVSLFKEFYEGSQHYEARQRLLFAMQNETASFMANSTLQKFKFIEACIQCNVKCCQKPVVLKTHVSLGLVLSVGYRARVHGSAR